MSNIIAYFYLGSSVYHLTFMKIKRKTNRFSIVFSTFSIS
ncbi:hypothetical protein HMPREF9171_1831 [Streptococcus agalactiae ATCC 13813]|nr:hypothetical protein HMPREF9171_1831 [Streptococcus agalactiae ATCC 13813]KXA52253.1 hypothetical protein HMPREF1881_00727 [Streptococcus agalactiae]